MSKYLVIFETNQTQIAANSTGFEKVMSGAKEWVQQNIDKGMLKSWGVYLTGNKGYGVWECNPIDLYTEIQKYSPYFTYEVNEVLSLDELSWT